MFFFVKTKPAPTLQPPLFQSSRTFSVVLQIHPAHPPTHPPTTSSRLWPSTRMIALCAYVRHHCVRVIMTFEWVLDVTPLFITWQQQQIQFQNENSPRAFHSFKPTGHMSRTSYPDVSSVQGVNISGRISSQPAALPGFTVLETRVISVAVMVLTHMLSLLSIWWCGSDRVQKIFIEFGHPRVWKARLARKDKQIETPKKFKYPFIRHSVLWSEG